MRQHGLSWHEKTLGQLFCDQKAPAVVDMLWAECRTAGVQLRLNTDIDTISREAEQFHLQTTQGSFSATSLVIATGGPSIPRMGATDMGIRVAKQFGLKNIPFSPALVPFTFTQAMLDGLFAGLAGVSTPIAVSCGEGYFREQMLFTHRGLSGPAMLQISSYWQKGEAVQIDLLPGQGCGGMAASPAKAAPESRIENRAGRSIAQPLGATLV